MGSFSEQGVQSHPCKSGQSAPDSASMMFVKIVSLSEITPLQLFIVCMTLSQMRPSATTWTYGLCDTEMRLGSSSNIPLQWARSWVVHTASYVDRPSSAQSVLTSSNHLFFDLPTGLEPWILPNKEMYGSRSAFILQTCPKYDKRRCCTSSTTVMGKPRVILKSSFLHLSLLVTPSILLRIVISNTKSLLLSDSFNVHVSEL